MPRESSSVFCLPYEGFTVLYLPGEHSIVSVITPIPDGLSHDDLSSYDAPQTRDPEQI